ncbi:hypothetical protein PC112_g17662 [Phytophthora cactorum]|nr:hypothetical protein PC112_g17662 [Phytophthora cactorum]
MELANLRRGHGGTKHRGDEWSLKTLGALLDEVVADALDMSLSRGVNDLLALEARYDAVFNRTSPSPCPVKQAISEIDATVVKRQQHAEYENITTTDAFSRCANA